MTLSSASLRKKAAALAVLLPIERLEPRALAFGVEAGGAGGATFAQQQGRRGAGARPKPNSAARAEAAPAARTSAPAAADSAPNEPWAVALSGGADSVALLLLLWAHWPERRGDLLALHFNHRMRGAAADEDERFCRKLCRALGVRLAVGQAGGREERPAVLAPPAPSAPSALRSEAQAREARFAFFAEKMAAARTRLLWLGHQQNDVAETLLMRLTRGSGPSGLAAPRPVQVIRGGAGKSGREGQSPRATGGTGEEASGGAGGRPLRIHLRPLLTLARAEIEAALRRCEIPWCEDATNAEGDFFRNRIRRDVLPALVEAAGAEGGRDTLAGMALARELIDEDDAALDVWANAITKTVIHEGLINLRDLVAVPRAVKRRVLHRWLRECAGAPALSRAAFEQLLAAVERGRSTRQSLGTAGFALIRRGLLRFEPNRS